MKPIMLIGQQMMIDGMRKKAEEEARLGDLPADSYGAECSKLAIAFCDLQISIGQALSQARSEDNEP